MENLPDQNSPEAFGERPSEPDAGGGQGELTSEAELSLMERILLLFTSPEKVFQSLAAKPRWLGAFAVLVVFSVASSQAIYPLLQEASREQILSDDSLTAEQVQQRLEWMESTPEAVGRGFMLAATIFGQAIWMVVVAAALLFGGSFLLGGESRFVNMLAIGTHAALVAIPKAVVTVPLMLSKGSMTVSTSLSVLLPPERWQTPIGILLGSVDLFNIWMIVLISIGLSAAYGFSRSKSTWLVISLYALMIAIFMGLSALGGSLMGG